MHWHAALRAQSRGEILKVPTVDELTYERTATGENDRLTPCHQRRYFGVIEAAALHGTTNQPARVARPHFRLVRYGRAANPPPPVVALRSASAAG